MKSYKSPLKSRVGKRIFILFVCCALVPIVALGMLSYSQVAKQLDDQCRKRLYQESKSFGMAIIERLSLLEMELRRVSSEIDAQEKGRGIGNPSVNQTALSRHFQGLSLNTDEGTTALVGNPPPKFELTPSAERHIRSGKSAVFTSNDPEGNRCVYMIRAVDQQAPKRGFVCAQIEIPSLVGISEHNTLPYRTEAFVLDETNHIIYSSIPVRPSVYLDLTTGMLQSSAGAFEWRRDGEAYLAGFWPAFLKYNFHAAQWTVVMAESKEDALAPMAYFNSTFPLVLLLSLWTVMLLSAVHIRKSLTPLGKLQEGTRRIARKEFDSRVNLDSRDEFQELAESFNQMAERLGKQFNALTTMAEIDRAILSSLEADKLAHTVLARIRELSNCDFACMTMLGSPNPRYGGQTFLGGEKSVEMQVVESAGLAETENARLREHADWLILDSRRETLPSYLSRIPRYGASLFVVFPIFLKGALAAVLTIGYKDGYDQEDVLQTRQVADQVAVALSNTRLVEELNQLNWGTLTALARAVDAKSSWTAGHSERVTRFALQIGRKIGLSPAEMARLNRGGLLHDIGKIGVPASILDKPGLLTEGEYRVIQEHPRLGVRILEPIKPFADVIDLVMHHHERFDGKGYPDGLAGGQIALEAKILAVADVYDALISDRPYRSGLGRERAVEIIREERGKQFDPDVVNAFLAAIGERPFLESVPIESLNRFTGAAPSPGSAVKGGGSPRRIERADQG